MEEKNHPFPASFGGGLCPDVQGSPRPGESGGAEETGHASKLFLFGASLTSPGLRGKWPRIPQSSLVNNKEEWRQCQGCRASAAAWTPLSSAEALEGWGLAGQEAGGLL